MSRRILFYGDSNTWGYRPGGGRLPANRRYTTMVTRQALDVIPVVNAESGRCSAWESAFVPAHLLGGATFAEALTRAQDPDGVVIMLGTNDVLPPLNLPPATIAENLRRMVRRAKTLNGGKRTIVLVSPPPLGRAALEEYLEAGLGDRTVLRANLSRPLSAMAAEEGVFFLSGESVVPCMDAEDGFHLAEVGHLRLGLALGSLLRSVALRRQGI